MALVLGQARVAPQILGSFDLVEANSSEEAEDEEDSDEDSDEDGDPPAESTASQTPVGLLARTAPVQEQMPAESAVDEERKTHDPQLLKLKQWWERYSVWPEYMDPRVLLPAHSPYFIDLPQLRAVSQEVVS